MPLYDALEGGEGHVVNRLTGDSTARIFLQFDEFVLGPNRIKANRTMTHDLAVDLVVAMPAPSVEHIGILADARVEQSRGCSEAGRAALDAILTGAHHRVGHCA